MPINSKYVYVASMDVDLDKEDLMSAPAPRSWESIILGIVIHSVARRMGEPAGALVGSV